MAIWTRHDPQTGRVIGTFEKPDQAKRTRTETARPASTHGLTEFRESGAGTPVLPTDEQLEEMIQAEFQLMGLSETAALIATAGRGGRPCKPRSRAEREGRTEDEQSLLEAEFRAMGLCESAAKIAAHGRPIRGTR